MLRALPRAVRWLFLAAAGVSFLFGGRLLQAFTQLPRLLGELAGVVLAILLAALAEGAEKLPVPRQSL